jgi:hypothetical protein
MLIEVSRQKIILQPLSAQTPLLEHSKEKRGKEKGLINE